MKIAKRPFLLLIRDGWGYNPDPQWNHANAIHLAKTPTEDWLLATYPHTLIKTCGEDVGLPAGTMGNSEVGHQNIGAGRIVDQEVMRITKAIREGTFFENRALRGAFEHASRTGGKVHLIGLCSDIGVHSVLGHLYALLEMAKRLAFPPERVILHFLGDGRDSPPDSGIEYCRQIEAKMAELGVGRIGSVMGRFYAMDRDGRWDRVERAYRAMVFGEGRTARSAVEAIQTYYDRPTNTSQVGDEFIEPTLIVDEAGEPIGKVTDGDSIIFFNFRGDRPREITRAFTFEEFPYRAVDRDGVEKQMGFDRGRRVEDLYYVTLTAYEEGLPVDVAFPKPPKMKNIAGEYWSDLGLRQFRCAETEKYAHVTFFFNDYREEPFPLEDRQIVPSPQVATYDLKPEMSAYEVTEEVLRRIEADQYDIIVMNYANGDMVGHTGNLAAAIRAVEAVDECTGRVVRAVLGKGGCAIVTADHGNCELEIDPASGGPHTAHTLFDTHMILVDEDLKGTELLEGGRLADIVPTGLKMLGLPQPEEMTGRPLLP